MDFHDHADVDMDDLRSRFGAATEILNATVLEMNGGAVPDGLPRRIAALMAAVARLALQVADLQNPNRDEAENDARRNQMLNDLVALATVQAVGFARQEYGDTLPSFSNN